MLFKQIKYSRGQQITFVVLACFIVGCFLIDWSIRKFYPYSDNCFSPDSTLLSDIATFEAQLDSIEWQRKQEFSSRKKVTITREKFTFDPNTIDSIDILRLGFQPFMAHNWLQYRRHGGKIYSTKKLRSIYNIDTLLVDSLSDYITFTAVKPIKKDTFKTYNPKKYFTFELNSADTTLLRQLPGIGKGRAAMIVAYRSSLGGFYSPKQLLEIENIPDSIIDNLTPYIKIELDSIKKIDINRASLKRLHRHPYINYYQAKAIYNLRWDKQHNGIISDLNELLKLKEITPDDFDKIKHYLNITSNK